MFLMQFIISVISIMEIMFIISMVSIVFVISIMGKTKMTTNVRYISFYFLIS
jgi:hypothetical protein